MKYFFRKKVKEEQRDLVANDHIYNSAFKYTNNEIKTSFYTWYNFIFINLFQQFHRVVNIYFVFLLVLQFIPNISSLNPITTLIPILIVLAITAIKDAVDDYYRHKSDQEINTRKVSRVKNAKLEKVSWMEIEVGDVVKLHNNEHVPADLLVLSSCEDQHIVYIETAELDGETNLKVRQALPDTGEMRNDINVISDFKGAVKCEAPNNRLHKFIGNLYWKNQTYAIDNDKILLRGCTVRNTEWCFSLVIFAGPETKLMQNSGIHVMKRTSIERFMNRLVWWIFLLLFGLCTITAIVNSVWETYTGNHFQVYLPWDSSAPNPQMAGFLMFWSNLILLNTLVPISLYVSVEFIRLGQSFFINWDRQMYYAKKNLPAVARTTTLNEELGQIQYVFSDKTGTLTQNIMKFTKCSISGKRYGDVFDQDGNVVSESECDNLEPLDLSYSEYSQPSFKFYDRRLIDKIQSGSETCSLFFRLLTLCHTAVIEETEKDANAYPLSNWRRSNDEPMVCLILNCLMIFQFLKKHDYFSDGLSYHTESPDEDALLSAARNFGFVYKEKTFDSITVIEMGKRVTYKVLALLQFNNVRKRMSIIVKDNTGRITLYCKGADSVIYERLHSGNDPKMKERTTKHLNSFSRSGLRTLCLALKHIEESQFNTWFEAYQKASTALEDREDKLTAVYEEIERDMILLGATAIEDKLQDGVPETIENLSKANIKIWVLTGDKQETAVNIGYSCNMLTENMKEVFVLKGYSSDEVETEIDHALEVVKSANSNGFVNQAFEVVENLESQMSNNAVDDITSGDSRQFGVVVNGHSLVYALEEDLKQKFLDLATSCSAVICCRVTPIQKARVVELVKRNKAAVTLAIGDGANDVSMIKAAHIGVGISGEEGTQAVLASDFAFGQFRYLERLLLVHGRWSYMRICKFLNYFFYKNFAFTLVHFWYGCFNGFTAQSAYDDWFVTLYNIIYTSTPILVLAILEQDVNETVCLRNPNLYLPGQENKLFNMKMFLRSLVSGILTSLVLFFFTYGALEGNMNFDGRSTSNHNAMTYVISTSLVFIVNFQVSLDTTYWTPINHLFTWGSIAIYFPFSLGLCSDGFYNLFPTQFPFIGVPRNAFSFPVLWFTVLLTTVTCIMPELATRLLRYMLWPTQVDKIIRNQQKVKTVPATASTGKPTTF